MSNSIWKTPDKIPEENKLIFAQHDRHRDGNIDYFIWDIQEFRDVIRKDSIRWCYLDELLAQADKAERLEKENEAMREEFEVWHGNYKCEVEEKKRLQKDLEIARKALKEISYRYQDELDKPTASAKWLAVATKMCDYADEALEQIEHIADTNKGQKK